MNKKLKVLSSILILLLPIACVTSSCSDKEFETPGWYQKADQKDSHLEQEAKSLINEMKGELTMPNMFKTFNKVETRSSGEQKLYTLQNGDFTIDWEASRRFKEEDGEVL